MANKWTAVNAFWNQFGLNAYDENTVPDGAQLPYITYEAQVSDLDDKIMLTASVWYQDMSWQDISDKAVQIEEFIGGGTGVSYDGGRLWVTCGSPFAQRSRDEADDSIRKIDLLIFAEYQ